MAKFEDEGDYKTEIEVTVKEEVWQCDVCGSDNAWGAVKCEACGNQHCTDSVSSKVESPDMVTSSVLLESSQTATSTGEIDGNNKPQKTTLEASPAPNSSTSGSATPTRLSQVTLSTSTSSSSTRSTDGSIKLDLTEHQKSRLVQEFDGGLTSYCSCESKEKIKDLVREFSWPSLAGTQRIKRWIDKRKQLQRRAESCDKRRTKKATPYTEYLRKKLAGSRGVMARDTCTWAQEKNNPVHYSVLKEKANNTNEHEKIEPSRERRVNRCYRKLAKAVQELESLGEAALYVVTKNKKVDIFSGSTSMEKTYLETREGEVFLAAMQCHVTGREFRERTTDSQRKVRTAFNEAYGEAIGKPGARVPYGEVAIGDLIIDVLGLPDGITFKEPSCYGKKKCEAILESQIVFKVRAKRGNTNTGCSTQGNNVAAKRRRVTKTETRSTFGVDFGNTVHPPSTAAFSTTLVASPHHDDPPLADDRSDPAKASPETFVPSSLYREYACTKTSGW